MVFFFFPGMLTITDFISILIRYYKSPLVSNLSHFTSNILDKLQNKIGFFFAVTLSTSKVKLLLYK